MIEISEASPLDFLQNLPFWQAGEQLLSSESAGESNMNLVLRVTTNQRSLILKQSKPYVRKYPQIPAPIGRIAVEHQFLDLISGDKILAAMSPKVVLFDPDHHILITEDLGKGVEYTGIYSGKKTLSESEITQLVTYLNQLHDLKSPNFPKNLEMRQLNHEHIFQYPFQEENGFDLDTIQTGLQAISLSYKTDQGLKAKLKTLGDRYLGTGNFLLHGDFYPGSWLNVSSGIKVIDPEFGFLGDREFDLGVLLAHLDLGLQAEELKELVLSSYTHPLDLALVGQYRGVEILRRLIGIAQLPVTLTLSQKEALSKFGKYLILA